jgi:hypothetical protein
MKDTRAVVLSAQVQCGAHHPLLDRYYRPQYYPTQKMEQSVVLWNNPPVKLKEKIGYPNLLLAGRPHDRREIRWPPTRLRT